MRKALTIAVFGLVLLIVLIGLVSLAERPPALPEAAPGVTPASSAQPEPTTPSAVLSTPAVVADRESATPSVPSSVSPVITGRVVSLDGDPVGGARVFTSDDETITDEDGWFQIPVRQVPQWVTVEHPDFLPRTQAAVPGSSELVRLAPVLRLPTPSTPTQEEFSLDRTLDPGDPLENDAPDPTEADQSISAEAVNPRRAHLTFEYSFRNDGPGQVTRLDVYLAIPSSRDNQRISGLTFSVPYTLVTDRYGQALASYEFTNLAPGQQVALSWEGDVEIEAMDYGIDPSQVAELDQIPPDIVSAYTTNESLYRLESPIVQRAAQVAADGATNPYWIARNVHDFVANWIRYNNNGQWEDAEEIYLQQSGSCSEYTILFVALCRANGLPARYVAATRKREEGTYVDTVFHRWAEVYLLPYGWVPVDVTHDDLKRGVVQNFFGAISDDRFVTTVGGGDSEYLGWNYHYKYRFDYSGDKPNITRERSFTWEPYLSSE